MTQLRVRNLVIRYGRVLAVDDISFDVEEGEFISLLGPSGCGKTTTLRCIAGLESLASGEIHIAGELVASAMREMPPDQRGVNMVFQSYAVWPHMTVFENVAYGLRTRHCGRVEIAERVGEALRMVGLSDFATRYGTELSGGQQQRIAVARAVVTQPRLLLFDEPLSNLDAGLRERMRAELVDMQRRLGATSLYVTHDQAEAMVMSDRIILMDGGRIVQHGRPRDIYENPASRFAAEFIGNANLLEGHVIGSAGGGAWAVRMADGSLLHGHAGFCPVVGSKVTVCIRPEHLDVVPAETTGENIWEGRVRRVSYLGTSLSCEVTLGDDILRATMPTSPSPTTDSLLRLRIDPARLVLLPPA